MTNLSDFSKSGRVGQNTGIPSQFTRHLEELQRRVPVVGDKALIDLVNGIQVIALRAGVFTNTGTLRLLLC